MKVKYMKQQFFQFINMTEMLSLTLRSNISYKSLNRELPEKCLSPAVWTV
jgi:hypothetical protein